MDGPLKTMVLHRTLQEKVVFTMDQLGRPVKVLSKRQLQDGPTLLRDAGPDEDELPLVNRNWQYRHDIGWWKSLVQAMKVFRANGEKVTG